MTYVTSACAMRLVECGKIKHAKSYRAHPVLFLAPHELLYSLKSTTSLWCSSTSLRRNAWPHSSVMAASDPPPSGAAKANWTAAVAGADIVLTDAYKTASSGTARDVSFDATMDPGLPERAEWIKFLSLFFNAEPTARSPAPAARSAPAAGPLRHGTTRQRRYRSMPALRCKSSAVQPRFRLVTPNIGTSTE